MTSAIIITLSQRGQRSQQTRHVDLLWTAQKNPKINTRKHKFIDPEKVTSKKASCHKKNYARIKLQKSFALLNSQGDAQLYGKGRR